MVVGALIDHNYLYSRGDRVKACGERGVGVIGDDNDRN
jgi:hypothetical protein